LQLSLETGDEFVGQLGEMSVVEFEETQPERVGVKKPEMDSLVSPVDGNRLSFDLSYDVAEIPLA
jgi:hypothetical protein